LSYPKRRNELYINHTNEFYDRHYDDDALRLVWNNVKLLNTKILKRSLQIILQAFFIPYKSNLKIII